MTKEQWQEKYERLQKILLDFNIANNLRKGGSNKAKRSQGERETESSIRYARNIIVDEPELYTIASGGEDADGFARKENLEEFFNSNFFDYDLQKLLKKIEDKIKELESPE